MNIITRYFFISCLGAVILLEGRELRTPLSLWRGYAHYPINHYCLSDWDYEVWGGGYYRESHDAFSCKHGTHKVPLANLYFGSSRFKLAQAFANSQVNVPNNPWVSTSVIRPDIEYNEKGIMLGISTGKRCGASPWRIGARARLPVRFVTVRQNSRTDQLDGETLADVCCAKNETYSPQGNEVKDVFACRLDFLSALQDSTGNPLVNYVDPNNNNHISIAGIDATNANNSDTSGAKVHVIGRTNGTLPPSNTNYGQVASVVNTLPLVPANGGISDNQRAQFSGNTVYSPLAQNSVAQAQLFIVPTIIQTEDGSFDLATDARTIQTQIANLSKCIDPSLRQFLTTHNLSFDTQHIEGLGDLNTEFYVGYDIDNCVWLEGHIGIVFPTGKKINNTQKLLAQPLGNNGHFELRFGADVGWEARPWIKVKADSLYSFVLKRDEPVAAAFTGATVKNIGPCIITEVNWGYYLGHIDLTFLNPCNSCMGIDIGYELYAKQRDHICFSVSQTRDFLGIAQPLDARVLERFTNVVAHKARLEFFYVQSCYNVFAGWTHVFAGKNAPRETDWYLGMGLEF